MQSERKKKNQFFFRGVRIQIKKVNSRRAGIEPAYSDYEPNELPVTQPPPSKKDKIYNRTTNALDEASRLGKHKTKRKIHKLAKMKLVAQE